MAERPRKGGTPARPTITGGPPKPPFEPPGNGPGGQNRPPTWPGSYQQNELGGLLPEPFPPPFPELAPPSLDRLRREYVAGGGWAWYGQVARTLPNAIDDVTADFGDDLYDRMLYDPQIAAVATIFKAGILETGITLTSAVRSRYDPDYEIAAEIADEAQRMLTEFEGSIDDVLWNLLDCVSFGNKVAEQSYRLAPAHKDGRQILVLDKLKVRPRRATVFAVDIYMNIVGLLIRVPPNASPWSSTMMFGPDDEPFNLIPPHKFVITTFRAKDADPRGTSLLRPAYSAWWRKQQIIPEYLKYLSQFAGPSLIGFVGPDSVPQPDPNNPTNIVTAEQFMLTALQTLRNGTAAAFPNGATVTPIQMQGDGAAFLRAIDHCDQQITKAVLTQELATEEGKHMARAAAQVHQDVLDTLIQQSKLGISAQIRNQLFKRWVAYNWGDLAMHLAPKVGFGRSVQRDQPSVWGSVAQLMGQGYLANSQLQELDAQIGLPIRDELEVYPLDQTDEDSDSDSNSQDTQADGQGDAAQGKGETPNNPVTPPIVPSSAQHRPTKIRPALPDMIGVRAHSRRKPNQNAYQPDNVAPPFQGDPGGNFDPPSWDARTVTPPNSRGNVPGVTGTTPQQGGVAKTRGKRRSQLYSVTEASSTPGSPMLPTPSAGMFTTASEHSIKHSSRTSGVSDQGQ